MGQARILPEHLLRVHIVVPPLHDRHVYLDTAVHVKRGRVACSILGSDDDVRQPSEVRRDNRRPGSLQPGVGHEGRIELDCVTVGDKVDRTCEVDGVEGNAQGGLFSSLEFGRPALHARPWQLYAVVVEGTLRVIDHIRQGFRVREFAPGVPAILDAT